MATQPIERTASAAPVPPAAISRVLSRFDRAQLAGFVAVAIDLMDLADPDPEAEDSADREGSDGDDQDQAWIEWQAMRGSQKRGPMNLAGQEDDEDADPPEDDDSDRCLAGEDWLIGGPALIADAMGFSSRPSRYSVGMDEDCEPPLPAA